MRIKKGKHLLSEVEAGIIGWRALAGFNGGLEGVCPEGETRASEPDDSALSGGCVCFAGSVVTIKDGFTRGWACGADS
jgi:hypothetical protein